MKRLISKRNILILAFCLSDIVKCQHLTFGENVALLKPANQSSTYEEERFMFNASLGVDGNISTNFYRDKTCSHTNAGQQFAWWTVDLQGFFFIKVIRIYQLTKRPIYSRLDGAELYVRVEDSMWRQIQFNSYFPPEMFDVNVNLDKRISSIKLSNRKRTLSTDETFISICELEAYEVLACSPFLVRNGKVRVVKVGDAKQNFTYGTQLNVTCKTGYQLFENRTSLTEPDNIIECMGTKTWSRHLTCSAIDCGQPYGLPDHSKVTITPGIDGNTTYNSTMTIHCNEGYNYSLQSAESLRCGGNGSWGGSIGNCNIIDCEQLNGIPGNSTFTSKSGISGNTSYNTTVTIKCNAGFRYTHPGKETVRCNIDGNWSSIQGTCKAVSVNPDRTGLNVAGLAVGVTAAGLSVIIIAIVVTAVCVKRTNMRRGDNYSNKDIHNVQTTSGRREEEQEATRHITKDNHTFAQPIKREDKHDEVKPVSADNGIIDSNAAMEYYSYLPQNVTNKHAIPLEQLSSFFLSRNLEPELYEVEYNHFKQGLTKPHDTSLLPENRKKNRYKHIYPYDDTRVQLEVWDPKTETDYINASFVNGFKAVHAYIASQGPTKYIIKDFWRMIWQTNSSKIVMLTKLREEGKHKCEQYWPDENSTEYGAIAVRLVQSETFSDFKIRTLEVIKKDHSKGTDELESRIIKQFHFTAWPDQGVPRYASSLVHFRHKVCKTKVPGAADGPVVVHCSAGIGRTGTYLALDYLVSQAEETGSINVVSCVESLRKQRVNLVQTVDQYVFLHEAVVEALTCTTSACPSNEFHEAYRKLVKLDADTGKRMLDFEFEKLPMYVTEVNEDAYANARRMNNRKKNRYANILPDNNFCPVLNLYAKESGSYINALFLPAYKEDNIFIITQTPLEETKVDFWRMVYQFEVNSIVMMNNLSQMKAEERYWPDDDTELEIPPFKITLANKSADTISTRYTFTLRYHDECRKVRLSRSMYWADGESVPKSPSSMLMQIDLIQSWQQETGNKPIIVHCMDGNERSGLFCVIAALLERTKIEQDVAVEQIIKQMRSRRPQIIINVDQFKFCYDAVKTYLDMHDTYSNFTGN
ncbi:hypothetical protein ACJMK2_040891 [Sinanodonta woodiana]|uniref:protein-tyrosine-phosphatase n=1 Tax=Sinanodonta woodiana TaxID=1069815 RepID=A0ABD3W490_SINWO